MLRAALLGHMRLGESFEEISRLRVAVARALAAHIEDFIGMEDLPAGRSWFISRLLRNRLAHAINGNGTRR
eukprot:7205937-Alexandrium_andersonii.AAC.1